MLKKLGILAITLAFSFTSFTPVFALESDLTGTELTNDELTNDLVVVDNNATLRMVIRARWGYVRGRNSDDNSVKNYEGSILGSPTSDSRIHLLQTEKWEQNDIILTKDNPVSWSSIITTHWDGVKAAVSAKSSASISVNTTQGSITKTAKEWYQLHGPEILTISDDGQVLVVQVIPEKRRGHFATVWWGKKDPIENTPCTDVVPCQTNLIAAPKVDFKGYMKMSEGGAIAPVRTLRFEKLQGDKLRRRAKNGFSWQSFIRGGRDGVLVRLKANNDAPLGTSFTVVFNSEDVQFEKTVTLEELHKEKTIRVEIPTNKDGTYVLVIGTAKETIKQLIRKRNNNKDEVVDKDDVDFETSADDGEIVEDPNGNMYVVSDGFKRKIANSAALRKFKANKARIKKLSQKNSDEIPDGEDLNETDKHPNGTLVKQPNSSAVWLVDGNKRRVFTHFNIFKRTGRSFDEVVEVTDEEFTSIPWGAPVNYPDGSLIKFSDKKVYIIDKRKRRHIESEDDFNGLDLAWDEIVVIPDSEVFNYEEGDPIVADEQTDIEVL